MTPKFLFTDFDKIYSVMQGSKLISKSWWLSWQNIIVDVGGAGCLSYIAVACPFLAHMAAGF
jgi:hypothetical protein